RLVPFVCMPSPIPRQDRWALFTRPLPSTSAFPRFAAGRLLHHPFRGLHSVHYRYSLQNLPSRQKRPSTPEASAASLPPLLLRLLPGGVNQFPGGTLTRCEPAPFHGARESQVSVRLAYIDQNPVFGPCEIHPY